MAASSSTPDRSLLFDRLAALLENVPVMVWMARANGHCTFVNRTWLGFRGRTLEEELGSGWIDGLHPDDRAACLAAFADATSRRIPFDAEYRWRRADSVYRMVQVSGVPLAGDAYHLDDYVGSCVDVTEQRIAACALEHTSELLQRDVTLKKELERERDAQVSLLTNLVANLNAGVVVESPDGRVLLANEAFRRLFDLGPPAPMLTGSDVQQLTSGLGLAAARTAEIRAQRRHTVGEELALADGRVLALDYAPIMSDDDGCAAHLWQYCDITARKRFEAELNASRQRLRDLSLHDESVREAERRRVAHLLHDELGQLLTSIKLELASGVQLFEAIAVPSSIAVVDRLQAAIGLLDVSVTTLQRVSSEVRSAALGHLGLPEAIRFEALLFEQRTKVRCRVSVNPATLRLDAERSMTLYRILLEALTNVARHAEAGAVRISLKKGRGVAFLSIADNGRGIEQDRLEDPAAMGLLGMRERALALGGDVRVTSDRRGTRVIAVLPLRATARAGRELHGKAPV